TITRDVGRRERRDGEALLAELLAPLIRLRLVRVVRESELDGVFEHHCGALAEVIEQRRGRPECRRERIGAGSGAALAQRLDKGYIGLKLVFLIARHVPTERGEALGESGCAFERVLACGQ